MSDRGRAASSLPTTIDVTVPHEARVYDYWLGGRDNYPADRALGDEVAAHVPGIRTMARANRAFLGRAVRYIVQELGVTQFLDIGTGIPTANNTHEVAQAADPTARVVYVDKDPIVLAHARALMGSTPEGRTAFIHADLADPDSIIDSPTLAETLDFDRPIALMMVSVLMYFRDDEELHEIVRRLLAAIPSRSCLAITHPGAEFDPHAMSQVVAAAARANIFFCARDRAGTEKLFAGTTLVDPGVVPVLSWHPDCGELVIGGGHPDPEAAWYWAGIGSKP